MKEEDTETEGRRPCEDAKAKTELYVYKPRVARSLQKLEEAGNSPLEPLERESLCQHLDLRLWPPELRE